MTPKLAAAPVSPQGPEIVVRVLEKQSESQINRTVERGLANICTVLAQYSAVNTEEAGQRKAAAVLGQSAAILGHQPGPSFVSPAADHGKGTAHPSAAHSAAEHDGPGAKSAS